MAGPTHQGEGIATVCGRGPAGHAPGPALSARRTDQDVQGARLPDIHRSVCLAEGPELLVDVLLVVV